MVKAVALRFESNYQKLCIPSLSVQKKKWVRGNLRCHKPEKRIAKKYSEGI